MNKSTREYLRAVCKRFGIAYPTEMGRLEIQAYMESRLREKGLSEYEIRQEFSSDWELLIV